MDRTIRKVTDAKSQLMETLRYWQSRPDYERMEAVAEIVREAYAWKGVNLDAEGSKRSLTRIQRSWS